MSSEGFIGLATTLSRKNMTIIYDQRGTGLSKMKTLDSSTVNMEMMLTDIEALREHLKIKRWIVLGHSFGGMLASYYTTRYPGRVQGLILSSSGGIDLDLLSYLNIPSRLSRTENDSLNFWDIRIANGDTSYHARLERGTFLAPAYLYDKKYVPVVAERLTQGNSRINGLIWSDMRRIKFDCASMLSSFKNPVLIIQGEEDIIQKKTAYKAAKALSNSKVVFVENAAHYGWMENREKYLKEIDTFISSL